MFLKTSFQGHPFSKYLLGIHHKLCTPLLRSINKGREITQYLYWVKCIKPSTELQIQKPLRQAVTSDQRKRFVAYTSVIWEAIKFPSNSKYLSNIFVGPRCPPLPAFTVLGQGFWSSRPRKTTSHKPWRTHHKSCTTRNTEGNSSSWKKTFSTWTRKK